ncbi:MAG: tRNA-uridine aminocarboxypropyltransferase [Gammaproteobacteria bacterium]
MTSPSTTPQPALPRRVHCQACTRPVSMCLCSLVASVVTDVELLILQHPLEVSNAKGSARLLALSLPGSRILTGETFDEVELVSLLSAGGRAPVLLYPETPDARALGLPPATMLARGALPRPDKLRLVVLDGTWRKSRKLLYVNPPLQVVPRFALAGMPPSHYRVRKAHHPDQLSTLEAACYALAQIDGDANKFRPILAAFDTFVERLAARQTDVTSTHPVTNEA